jgi:uncharacterized transporter YbjL
MHTWWLPTAVVGYILGVLVAATEVQKIFWIILAVLVVAAGILVWKKFPDWFGLFGKLVVVLMVFMIVSGVRAIHIKNNLTTIDADVLVGSTVILKGEHCW